MPQVVTLGETIFRRDAHACLTKPVSQVVVLTAPADKLLIEAVDALEVVPSDGQVAAHDFRLRRMAD